MAFITQRDLPASPDAVHAAIADPLRLARWWGPAGFRNVFERCEFEPGGAWVYVMLGPDGKRYPNESLFEVIEPGRQVVIRHVSQPRYRLSLSLTATDDGGTRLRWEQVFDDPRVAAGIAHIVEPANEQNLDRLAAELRGD